MFDFQDMDFIKNIVGDLTPDFDSEWISTFSKQVQCLATYFKSHDLNPQDYKLIRYGDKYDIGGAYKKFSDAYTKAMDTGLGSQKDNFDPADVIAYNVNKIGYINSKLTQYSSSPVISKENYKEELFDTHLVVGISLKKISGNKSPQFDLYNTGHIKCDNVNSFEVLKNSNKTQLLILCKGKFNFDSTTENGDEIGSQNSVKLVMRSFGDGTTAVDCTLINPVKKGSSPTLGKCPARFWREVIGSNKNADLETNVRLFRSFIEKGNSREVLTKLKDLIKAAVKEGPSCFPFVLIH